MRSVNKATEYTHDCPKSITAALLIQFSCCGISLDIVSQAIPVTILLKVHLIVQVLVSIHGRFSISPNLKTTIVP